VGVGRCGRDLGVVRMAERKGARDLPEMGSEVLGTERGTRPDAGPLSTTNSNSGKGKAGGGPGSGRGRASWVSIFGSAWLPGGARPAACAQDPSTADLSATCIPSAAWSAHARRNKPSSAPSRREQWPTVFFLQPIEVE
jgi:hypothetical protein